MANQVQLVLFFLFASNALLLSRLHRTIIVFSDVQASSELGFARPVTSSSRDPPAEIREIRVSPSSLPTDLQSALREIRIIEDGRDVIDPSVVEEALRALLNKRERRIPLSDLDPNPSNTDLKTWDLNENGFLDHSEILNAVKEWKTQRERYRYLLCFSVSTFATMMIFLAAIFGLVYVVVDMHKVKSKVRL
jgi:hypothetical protein